ncbi:S-adenosyl-L-methionine-dependent methyltransferase [Xylariales sp. PMI_506]|nr:S-adenosyl-L-methionine-dependent methyltransferase [Xylariales sp. PMI_506]
MHSHEHSTASSPPETFAEKNAKHFDKVILDSWPEWVVDLRNQIVEVLAAPDFPSWLGLDPSEDVASRRMLDYATGDGFITEILKPHFGFALGVDVSGGMLAKYKAAMDKLGLGPDQALAVRGDLLADDPKPTEPPVGEDQLWNFDLVATSLALHHFENPELAIQRLAARLRPGGVLLILDWTPQDGSTPAQREYEKELQARSQEEKAATKAALAAHASSHTISKPDGFTKEEITTMFEAAGCTNVRWKLAEQLSLIPLGDTKFQLFFAGAIKV